MARGWHLIARPRGLPAPGDFALRDIMLLPLDDGMVRVRNLWLSVDPYMRGRMNDVRSYVPPFALDEPMTGGAIGEVVESRAAGFAIGDRVLHMLGWRDEAVAPAAAFEVLPEADVPLQAYLGMLGLTGMTGYFGLLAVAEAKPGDILFVSAAAGAVGLAVVQIAKAKGMTVIGAAGGADKGALLRSLGADAVIDYKACGSLVEALAAAAPKGIDVYFDNVGGDHLDAALAAARPHARFAICGMIDAYNSGAPTVLPHLTRLIGARVRIQGFIITDYLDRTAGFRSDMAGWLADGTVRSHETVHDGLASAVDAFLALFSGGNSGKMLVRL